MAKFWEKGHVLEQGSLLGLGDTCMEFISAPDEKG